MQPTLLRPRLIKSITFLLVAVLVTSCGSYQQASYYEDDGIYSSGNRVVQVEKKSPEAIRAQQVEDNIYGEYFGQKADQYGDILDNEVFTDIDDYYSGVENDSIAIGEQTDYFATNNTYEGNEGWGDNPTNVSINVYDNGWGWGGFNDPWLWNGGLGFGWGWNNWGWNRPWGWNAGFGWGWGGLGWNNWGWGWNRPWGWNAGFGWGGFGWNNWGRGFYGNGFNRGFYNNNYAFNRSRRGYSNNTIARNGLREC